MQAQTPKYRIYPSLLDQFQSFLDHELLAEESWNKVSETNHMRGEYTDREIGDYKLTPDEMALREETALINMVNRCPKEPSEAADKGTVFNEIVDCLHEKRPCALEGCSLRSDRASGLILAVYNDFQFVFDLNFCIAFASMFKGSLTQFRVEAEMETSYGPVLLYGYMDEWKHDRITDIKTTSYYEFGKYGRKWQRHLYPWCAIESGLTQSVTMFEYSVAQFPKNTYPIKGNCYREEYPYDHEISGRMLRDHVERFIEWLEYRREYITNNAVFGGENPEGYAGVPITVEQLKSIYNG